MQPGFLGIEKSRLGSSHCLALVTDALTLYLQNYWPRWCCSFDSQRCKETGKLMKCAESSLLWLGSHFYRLRIACADHLNLKSSCLPIVNECQIDAIFTAEKVLSEGWFTCWQSLSYSLINHYLQAFFDYCHWTSFIKTDHLPFYSASMSLFRQLSVRLWSASAWMARLESHSPQDMSCRFLRSFLHYQEKTRVFWSLPLVSLRATASLVVAMDPLQEALHLPSWVSSEYVANEVCSEFQSLIANDFSSCSMLIDQ